MQTLLQIILGRIIAGFFGKYTLMLFYKITGNKEGLKWLNQPADEMEAFTGGCIINLVGLASFTSLFIIFCKLMGYFFY